jgi:hypothetical protein
MGDFIRIPPDSAGKMIRHRDDIYYSNPTLLAGDGNYNDFVSRFYIWSIWSI